jgi:hypothetical protein
MYVRHALSDISFNLLRILTMSVLAPVAMFNLHKNAECDNQCFI